MSTRTLTPSLARRRFNMLLRRELWEYRGSFIWAPLLAGGSVLLLLLLGLVLGKMNIPGIIELNGIAIGGRTWDMLLDSAAYTPQSLQSLTRIIDAGLMMATVPVFMALAFAVFFYALGALYDDRRDRSVLFWASLPVSDTQTVLSKLVTATLLAPAIAVLIAVTVMVAGWCVLVLFMWFHGAPFLWLTSTNLFRLVLTQFVALPVYALWALPAVSWLLLCSAFARSKPALWAVLVPLLAGVLLYLSGLWGLVPVDWLESWGNGVLPLFGRLFPLTLLWLDAFKDIRVEHAIIQPGVAWLSLRQTAVWMGAGMGALMVFAVIGFRRWRVAESA